VALREVRPELSAPFLRVVERAIDPDPVARFASAADMGRALGEVMGEPYTPMPPPRPEAGRRTTATGVELRPVAGGRFDGSDAGRHLEWKENRFRIPRRLLGPLAAILGFLVFAPTYLEWRAANEAVEAEAWMVRVRGERVEALAPAASVRPGDRLALSFEASRAVHLYVLATDPHGRSYLLFPEGGSDLRNPLSAAVEHLVPGDRNRERGHWAVPVEGIGEALMVIASPSALPELEALVAALPPAEPGRPPLYPHVPGPLVARLPSGDEEGGRVWVQRLPLGTPPAP
jgi:hypothetical protein